jgi:hypothetical protein
MKALEYIGLGWQRLLTFESRTGGFDWSGGSPGNVVLSAWGILQLTDMARVYAVDERVIDRTKRWLLGLQQADGTWQLGGASSSNPAFSWGRVNGSVPITAYVTWALAESGVQGEPIQRALRRLAAEVATVEDPYLLALFANAFASAEPRSERTMRLLRKLDSLKRTEGTTTHWDAGVQTFSYARGAAADVETTALAVLAFLEAGTHASTVNPALTWLVQKKSADGTWGSTSATILALKALLGAAAGQRQVSRAHVQVFVNGDPAGHFDVTPDNSDLYQSIDLTRFARRGQDNEVRLESNTESSMAYQIVGRWAVPWGAAPRRATGPLRVRTRFDRTQLRVEETIRETITLRYEADQSAFMILLDVGIPPGFDPLPEDLDAIKSEGLISRWEKTPRQIMLYFDSMPSRQDVTLSFRMRARFPVRAQAPRTEAYEYYTPTSRAVAAPTAVRVDARR